jgi:hypothetical protein
MRAMNQARWQINDDDEKLSLQIEFGNDHGITLTIHKGGSEPHAATIWIGNTEHAFSDETLEGFTAWLAGARSGAVGP